MSKPPVARWHRAAALVGLCGALLLAGCTSDPAPVTPPPSGASSPSVSGPSGSSSGSTSSGSGTSSPTGSSTSTPTAQDGAEARALLARTSAAIASSTSFRMTGTTETASGVVDLDLQISRDGGRGAVILNGQPVQLIVTADTVYLKASATFWTEFTTAAGAKQLDDTWVKVAAQGVGKPIAASFTAFTDFDAVAGQFTDIPADVVLSVGAVTDFSGVKVFPITQVDSATQNGSAAVLYIAARGEPLLVGLINGDTGKLVFSSWGERVDLSEPGGTIIDLTDVLPAAPAVSPSADPSSS